MTRMLNLRCLAALALFLACVPLFAQTNIAINRLRSLSWTNSFTNGSITLLYSTNLVDWLPARHMFSSTGITAVAAPQVGPAVFFRFQNNDISLVPSNMALVPEGEFQMGDNYNEGQAIEQPVHGVYVSSFLMEKFEVTNEQMRNVMQWAFDHGLIDVSANRVTNREGQPQPLLYLDSHDHEIPGIRVVFTNGVFWVTNNMEQFPITGVSWYGAQAFCNYRSDMEGLPRCVNFTNWTCDFSKSGYRLPTEAEWEKAARGGLTGHHFPWESYGGGYANYIPNNIALFKESGSPYDLWQFTPVGFYNGAVYQKQDLAWPGFQSVYQTANSVNGYGLFDMAGNAWELCYDYWQDDWYSDPQSRMKDTHGPNGPFTGTRYLTGRVMRGGGQGYYQFWMRCACRYFGPWPPDGPSSVVGFRCARSL